MRTTLLLAGIAMLTLTASCARHQPLLADASDAIRATATDATASPVATVLVTSADVQRAAASAAAICARQSNCPAVRVRRADALTRSDGSPWLVVRLNACGEERVYEKRGSGWRDATVRLR